MGRRVVTFDLDGTLVDTVDEIALAANAALNDVGFAGVGPSAVRAAVTKAVTELVGLEVTEVNIAINDVNIPALNGVETDAEGRVR